MLLGSYEKITIWNKYRDQTTNKDSWQKSVIPGCSWEHREVRNVAGQTASIGSTTSVLINENKLFVTPKNWAPGTETFTINIGDLVARGEHNIEITGEAPYRESEVRQSLLPDVFIIKTFNNNTQGYKMGRHYDISGV